MTMANKNWSRMLQRVRTMNRAEIADRIRQQATARLDFLRHKIGSEPIPVIAETPGHLRPQFFFQPDSVPELCSKLRQLFPETAARIVARAERICQHRFDLLGYEDIDYGSEIDWHFDRVNGKQAPRKPSFQVKYLDFAQVGDSKVTWELNRHQHLVTLAKAYCLTGDEKFASELFRQWHQWHAQNPYPIGINWASSLEVAFRALSWIWLYHLLAGSPVMPAGFRRSWLRALAISGRHIDCYLSTYFSPNTHLLGEAVALFFIGTLCPEIASARRWQQRGWQTVLQEANRQVRSDGLHFEQSTYYHVYALDFFLHSAILASVNHIDVPKEFDNTIERMLDALAALARNGPVPRLGDDDGGRLFDPSRNCSEHMLDPLATGAVLFGRGDFKSIAGRPREEMLWLLGEPGLQEFDRIPASKPPGNSAAFGASGLYLMTGDGRDWQLVIDAGPQGAHTAGHGHADALSLTANYKGRVALIDSGTFQYVGRGSERDVFRSTSAHNTLGVAGLDQAEGQGPFRWENLPNVEAEGWIAGKTFDLFVGSHDGYSRLPNPAVHRRFVFALKSGLWFVRDLVLGSGEYPLDLYWHIDREFIHKTNSDCFVSDSIGLQFLTPDGQGWMRSVEEHVDSPAYGRKRNHPVLHFSTKVQLPSEFVSLIVPFVGAPEPESSLTKIPSSSERGPHITGYRFRASGDEHLFFFGRGTTWSLDHWSSDAECLYARRSENAGMKLLICCNATFVTFQDQRILTASQPVLRCEVIAGERPELVSSNPDAVTFNLEAWKTLSGSSPVVAKTI